MAIGPYSLCPGGTGKKIKFCCPELLGDLRQIDRMVSGEQFLACLRHIEGLEQKHPDKACLLAIKARLLRFLDQLDKAGAVVARFLQKYPDNQIALAESAILAAGTEDGAAGMRKLQRALAAAKETMYGRIYEAMEVVAQVLVSEGQIRASRAILQLLAVIAEEEEDNRLIGMIAEVNRSLVVPLLIKDDPMLVDCPEDVPWKARFDEAMELAKQVNWQASEQQLSLLAEEVGDVPAIWRNLALLRGWLADTPGWIEALHKYASLDVPLEDAVEAEALVLLLGEDPLGDNLDVLMLTYDVEDPEQLQAALAASPRTIETPVDSASLKEGETPPRAACWLLNRPMPENAEGLTTETIPRALGQAMLFGRQTDREARLEVFGITSRNLGEAEALLGDIAGDGLPGDTRQEIMGQVSASQEMLRRSWRAPEGITIEQVEKLTEEHIRHVVLEEWPHLPLGLFDENTPEQVARDDANRVKVLAAVMLLESWSERAGEEFDFNQLRAQLGLPELGPIDPEQTPLDELPLVRLARVTADKLSDEQLLDAYSRAIVFGILKALRKFGRVLVDRPSFDGKEEQLRTLGVLARTEDDSDRALEYIERGRRAVTSKGESCAPWDLLELPVRVERMEAEEMFRLIDHLRSDHLREPGVAQALTELLVQTGLIRPDGSLAEEPPEEEPSLVVPGASGAEPGKLWTPESQKPADEKPAIWTPDMG